MRHRLSTLLGGAALIGAAATGPVSAAGADHAFFPEHYDAYEHFAAGQGFCVPWAGTFHEVRHGGYRLVAAPGGQQSGELHINGVITGTVELIPDDNSLPNIRRRLPREGQRHRHRVHRRGRRRTHRPVPPAQHLARHGRIEP